MTEFYQPASGLTFTEANLAAQTGLLPTQDPSVLALNGVYEIVPSDDPYDPALYDSTPVYTIVGNFAEQGWTATPLPLPTAKANGSAEAKENADAEVAAIVTASGFSNEILTAAASQVAPPVVYQDVLDEMTVVTNQLDANLTAINAAATVDEINNIVNPPTGVINIGRGQFGGPLDLNASNYVSFNSISMTEADTELYAPSTSSVVPYQGFPPDDFNSSGAIFTTGNYLIQIREVATSMIIAEFEVPLSTDGSNEDISF